MKNTSLDYIIPYGTAATRMFKNLARMHDRYYQPGVVGTPEAENVGWPGDWEGRTVLALTLLARALKTEPAYLDEIVDWVKNNCNDKGYRGEHLDLEAVNEQQLSGHGWLLRGLAEYCSFRNDFKIKKWIETIVRGLFLPLRGKFAAYPRRPEDRVYEGAAAGELAGKVVSGWSISSDTGCAFISLDGLTHAYELLKLPELFDLIDEMIGVFKTIDFIGITMQTHATLTATRGVMRMYRLTGNAEYLAIAERIFALYKKHGMTENYANFNWFCRPSWTEPCGAIDSFMLAFYLWEATGKEEYLEDAHLIWYNGVSRGQRPNGGFGCDECVEDGFVRTHAHFYEAYWCCSMRGGEGLTSSAQFALYTHENRIVFPFYSDGRYQPLPDIALRVKSRYPEEGHISVRVENGNGESYEWAFFLPSWVKNAAITVNGKPVEYRCESGFATFKNTIRTGDLIEITFGIPLFTADVVGDLHQGKGYRTLRYGTYILGARSDSGVPEQMPNLASLKAQGKGVFSLDDVTWQPLDRAYLLETETLKQTEYRILFV